MKHHYPYDNNSWVYDISVNRIKGRFERLFPQDYVHELQVRSHREANNFLEAAVAAVIGEQPKATCLEYFQQAHQFNQINFMGNMHVGKTFTYNIKGVDIDVTGVKISGYTEVSNWDTAICLAIILRDKSAINDLCFFESRNFIDKRGEQLPVEHAYCDFLKGLYNPEANLQALLTEVMTLSGPEHMPERRQAYIYYILLPFIEIIIAVLANNEQQYHQAITKALESNHLHYSDTKRKNLFSGWMPLHICAAAVIGYDQCGFKLPEPTPYIPEWLIYGEY